MPDVNVNFMHPTDGRVITVTVDDTMTAQEAIGELLANNFVPPHGQGYQLSVVENGNIIGGNQTMAEAGVRSGSKIKVLPITEAGAE
jgi:hypothetical protein